MSSREREPNTWSLLRGKHILIAEDEPAVRGMLRTALEMQGCVVHEAENGQRAAELARQVPVDLVMTDLWMPVMNGVELIEALNAMDCPAGVIVLSAHITCATTEKLRRLGVLRMLRKPVGVPELLGTVRAGLRGDRQGGPAEEYAGTGAGDGSALVLVADDDDEVRGFLKTVLTGAGYRVEQARDGEEAVEKALAHDVGLILMDLNMPRMGGREAIETVKRASRDCLIVCMTGESTGREMDAALRAGAASCFRKPLDTAEILAEVERLDAISLHRRQLARRDRTAASRRTLLGRARALLRSVKHGYGRRLKWVAAATVAAIVLSAVAVPLVSSFVGRTAHAARNVGGKVDAVLESASRVEGYLQRDEARELKRCR
jgi:DNA-binding response OmpR family regulator